MLPSYKTARKYEGFASETTASTRGVATYRHIMRCMPFTEHIYFLGFSNSIQHGGFSWLDWLTAEEVGQELGGN